MKIALSTFFGWAFSEGKDFSVNMVRDLKSLRALWNYIFLALYTWIIVWGVLYYPTVCINTAITVTGGVVSVIFTGYVFTKSSEKRNGVEKIVVKDEAGESD